MKTESNLPDSWGKLAAARRRSLAASLETDPNAPFGFAQRLASRAMALQRHRQLAWWTRWSLRAAGAATVAAALVAMARAPETASSPLLAAPALEIPGFSSL
jgi:hypothetical protein